MHITTLAHMVARDARRSPGEDPGMLLGFCSARDGPPGILPLPPVHSKLQSDLAASDRCPVPADCERSGVGCRRATLSQNGYGP